MGQIGSGTCGQVYKMQYRPTGHIMAVKVGDFEAKKFMTMCIVHQVADSWL